MAYRPFFNDEQSEYFDMQGRPKLPGIYEFQRSDGRKIIFTLGFEDVEAGEAPPRLRVLRASRLEDFPSPAHALKNLDGQWIRFLGESRRDGEQPGGPIPEERAASDQLQE